MSIAPLASLEFLPFLNSEGELDSQFEGIGVYAIFDAEKTLQYIGYSRDVSLSLKQHLVRRPQQCYWLKVQTIDRPSRAILEEIRTAWIAENGVVPSGNGSDEAGWTQAIDAKTALTAEERSAFAAGDELTQMKLLKQVARRVESDVMAQLEARGVKMQVRFNPKLKENGLLDLK
ncbi:GIY-YIG nuclease family protein [Leptolyngbya sp. FACHB-1515]|nr:GIY-YIG nuclease family protein [Microcoleus sp. FACHB-1515]